MSKRNKELKLLLIEDNEDDALMIREMLHGTGGDGVRMEWSSSLKSGLEKIGLIEPDVILLDLSLPDNSGIEIVLRFSKEFVLIPLIILTGHEDEALAVQAVGMGAEDYLVKGKIDGPILRRSICYSIERNRIRSELDKANASLRAMAGKDPLTGVLNRRGLNEVLAHVLAQKRRLGIYHYALLLDLDNFKSINDEFGHGVGDIALQTVARAIQNTIRETDYIARVGGDEFVVILTGTRPYEAQPVAEKIRLAVSEAPIGVASGKRIQVTVSIGALHFTEDLISTDILLQVLHTSLRKSKGEGKNRIAYQGDITSEQISSRENMMEKLRCVLTEGKHFCSAIQPIMDLRTGTKVGYEIFARLLFPHFEMPEEFLRFAQSANLLDVVDRFCFRNNIKAAADLPEKMRIHLNLFPSTIVNSFPEEAFLQECPAAKGQHYCLELSEQQMMGDPSYLLPPIEALRKKGFLIAIDDLGFGHTSLESLVVLEPDIVKIDRSYIHGIGSQKYKRNQLARLLKIVEVCRAEAIAEGIETEEDLRVVKELGVVYGQGYLWGKPQKVGIKNDEAR